MGLSLSLSLGISLGISLGKDDTAIARVEARPLCP